MSDNPDDPNKASQLQQGAVETPDNQAPDEPTQPDAVVMPAVGDPLPKTVEMKSMAFFEETKVTDPLSTRGRKKRHLKRLKKRAYVLVRRAGAPEAKVEMDKRVLTFGRDPASCDIILDGNGVSRLHATIERNDLGYYKLRDCDSKNGTFVDGRPVRFMNILDGDVFAIGEHKVEFHVE